MRMVILTVLRRYKWGWKKNLSPVKLRPEDDDDDHLVSRITMN